MIHKSLSFSILALLFLFISPTSAQNVDCILQTDRYSYSIGDLGYGLIYVDDVKAVNKVLLVQILDDTSASVFSCYTRLNDKQTGEFYFSIPFNIPTNEYRVLISAAGKFESSQIISGKILIINPIQGKPEDKISIVKCSSRIHDLQSIENSISSVHSADELIIDNVPSNNIEKIISLSVVDANELLIPNVFTSKITDADIPRWKEKIFFPGSVSDEGNALQLNIIGAYVNQDQRFALTKSDEHGHFMVEMEDYTGIKSLQFFPYEKEVDKFNIQQVQIQNKAESEKRSLDEAEKSIFLKCRSRVEIEHYFGNRFLVETPKMLAINNYLGEPQRSYIPSDYIKFKDLKEFCKENSSYLTFTEDGRNVKASLKLPANLTKVFGYSSTNPFFLINGMLTHNADKISKFRIEDIKNILLYYNVKGLKDQFSVFGNEGLVLINTSSSKDVMTRTEKSNTFELVGFQVKPKAIQSMLASNSNNTSPEFYPCIYFSGYLEKSAFPLTLLSGDDNSPKLVTWISKMNDGSFKIWR